ncbi:hypothetical protein D3C86_2037740 [compost metagenome]
MPYGFEVNDAVVDSLFGFSDFDGVSDLDVLLRDNESREVSPALTDRIHCFSFAIGHDLVNLPTGYYGNSQLGVSQVFGFGPQFLGSNSGITLEYFLSHG